MTKTTNTTKHCNLSAPTGMSHGVGLLFASLEETRRKTRAVVNGLSTERLDATLPGVRHRIGALLFHIAGTEQWFVNRVVKQREASDLDQLEFAAADLSSAAADDLLGHGVEFYLGVLDEVRAKTESACWELKDDALDTPIEVPERQLVASPRYVLSFLCDHEAHHRGQIALLKRAIQSVS